MIKLYDKDSYIFEFSATVTSCEKSECGYRVILDQTAFFPTAGGQEYDSGTLNGKRVKEVVAADDEIVHITDEAFNVGENVIGKIDREQRFRKMQHHTAEHMVSGFVKRLYGFDNTGFHLGDYEVTMDYGGELSKEDIIKIEKLANKAVCDNVSVIAEYPNADELKMLDYRSKLDLTENVRIVTIDGIDVCACCAPHVHSTGECGMIKITGFMRHRGGVRMRMICGAEALADYRKKQESVEKISCLLSEKQENVVGGVQRVLDEISLLKQKNSQLKRELASMRAEKIEYTDGNLCIFEKEADMGDMMFYAEQCHEKCGGMLILCMGDDGNGYNYLILSKNEIEIKAINTALNGRGGGRNGMYRGYFGCKRTEIEECFR